MQGSIEQEIAEISITDKIVKMYEEKPQPSEFFDFKNASFPISWAHAIEKLKANFTRFKFYYIMMFLIFDMLFILIERLMIFPILASFGCYYIVSKEYMIGDYKPQPFHISMAFVAINLLLCMFIDKLYKCYIHFLALNGFIAFISILHGILIENKNTEENEEAV